MKVNGKKLLQYRKENGLSREELAEKLDLTSKTIQRIENGESTKESTVELIKNCLGLDIEIKDEFTTEQLKAINSDSKHLKVLAGAGAGKTRVAEEVIAKRMQEGYKPSELVVCTFTEKAAAELKIRTQNRLQEKGIDVGAADMIIGTIHGICIRLLQEYTDKYNDYTVLDSMKNIHFINRYFDKIGVGNIEKIGSTEKDRNRFMRKYIDTNRFLSICSLILENETDYSLVPKPLKKAVENYVNLLKEKHYFDFSTIQHEFIGMLRKDAEFREKVKNSIKFLIIDEYQDVNFLQAEIVKEFIKMGVRTMVIGDADQAIYQFRGSDYTFIKNFETDIDGVEVVKLEDNFRSTSGVIQIAEQSIRRNSTREDKQMISRNGKYEKGDIVYKEFENPKEEAEFIADRIEELIEMGMPLNEIAILFRKKKYIPLICEVLEERNILVDVENMSSLMSTVEIQAVTSIFMYLSGKISKEYLHEKWDFAKKYASEHMINYAIDELSKYIPEKWVSNNPKKMAQEYLLQEIYQVFISNLGILAYSEDAPRYEKIMFNLGKFSQLINDFEVVNYDYSPQIKIDTFESFLKYTDDEYPEGYLDDAFKKEQGVQLMTIHKSKGLQFSAVFIPCMCKNIFPSSGKGGLSEWHFLPEEAIGNSQIIRGKGSRAIEDERRIFYVAVTRSRKFVFLTRANYGSNKTNKVSEFLSEARTASGYIYEYDEKLCKYTERERWKPYNKEEVVFSIDFTNLSQFFNCQYGFRLSQIYGFVNPINLRMGYGASIHSMAKEVNKYVMENKTNEIPDEIMNHIKEGFYLPYIGHANNTYELMRKKAETCIEKFVKENGKQFSEVEYVEKYFEVAFRKDILVNGRIDLIRRKNIEGKWEVIIVDYKTGERKPSELEQRLQLEIYALGYKKLTGQDADVLEIVDIEGNEVVSSRAVLPDNLEDTAERIRDACDEILDNNNVKRVCEKNKCKNCNHRLMCYSL